MASTDSLTSPVLTFHDGNKIPQLGYGVWQVEDAVAERVVGEAFEAGYRHIDTAAIYGNEAGVGRAIASSGLLREEMFITTKLWNADQGAGNVVPAFEASLEKLGLEYVDLYLIHWPLPRVDRYVDSWWAMIKLRENGLVRSIGVSNFTAEHVDRLERETGVLPSVNQIEMHPLFPQEELRAAMAAKGVAVESWSPLGRGSELLADPAVTAAAAAHGRTPGQVVLRWHTQSGVVPIPKSADPDRQRENLDVFGFELTDEEMAAISAPPHRRLGGDPRHHEEF